MRHNFIFSSRVSEAFEMDPINNAEEQISELGLDHWKQ